MTDAKLDDIVERTIRSMVTSGLPAYTHRVIERLPIEARHVGRKRIAASFTRLWDAGHIRESHQDNPNATTYRPEVRP